MKNFIFALLTSLLLILSVNIFSQVNQEWLAQYDSSSLSAMTLDRFSNIYISGSRTSTRFCTVKYNPSGVVLWQKLYAGSYYTTANSNAVDTMGNVYVTGYTSGNGSIYECITIKYNVNGNERWSKKYIGPATNNSGRCIRIDNYNNIYVAGFAGIAYNNTDILLIKYDTSGNQIWISTYDVNNNSSDYANTMEIDQAGNILITGYTSGGSYSDYVTLKCNPSGVFQWAKTYNGPGNGFDYSHCLAIDSYGNVYVSGESSGNGSDYATIKYSPTGEQLWVQRYDDPFNSIDRAYSIAVSSSGNVYVTGESVYTQGYDFTTIKYNSSGVQQWVMRYDGPIHNDDRAASLTIDSLENIYVTGSSLSNPNGANFDYATVKYNSSGIQQWSIRYDSPFNGYDNSRCIALDRYNNIIVSGQSNGITTIKYSQTVGIKSISSQIPGNYFLYQNYPNPFNPTTKIKFDIPVLSFTVLTIIDITGREVKRLINENLNAGSFEVSFNADGLSSGVYFYRLDADGFREVKKMMIVK